MEKNASTTTTSDTRHIILLGKSGVGKSSLGNFLLGNKKFKTDLREERRTKECQIEPTDCIVVMDTPGFFSPIQSDVEVGNKIIETIKKKKLPIHVYILVLSADQLLSGDEKESVEFIKKLFGEDVIDHMIIVFTGKDYLEGEEFQFPRCLPNITYFLLDCKQRKEEEVKKIRGEIFSQKYKDITFVSDVDKDNWDAIEKEEGRRKNSKRLDVDGYVNAVQSTFDPSGSSAKSFKSVCKTIWNNMWK